MTLEEPEEIDKFEINEEHLELLNSVPEELKPILRRINNRVVFYMYHQASEILKMEIDPRFRDADQDKNDRGRIFFFYGDYDTGKSWLLKYSIACLKKKYPSYWNTPNEVYPVIKFDLEDNINTAEQFLLYILRKIGKPIDPRQLKQWDKTNSKELSLTEKLIKSLESYKTRILIIDESQRLIQGRNPNIPSIFEVIKNLTTKTNWNGDLRTHIIICGTHDAIPLLEAHNWIQGRTHSLQLKPLPVTEYGNFLWTIYDDYIDMGVSNRWDFVISYEETGEPVINPEISMFLYKRSGGKAGLTVELIRDAVRRAISAGRSYPDREDYALIVIEGKKYKTELIEDNPDEQASAQVKIKIRYGDRLCKVEGCPRSKKSYTTLNNLIKHYKNKHPEIIVVNSEGNRM
jgi:hypothetical protein